MNNLYVSLDEEIRDGFSISPNRKMLWNYLIEILKEIERVCEKLKIRYFAGGGTMLGAIRHKGFIPWDDDIDLMMERDDYEIFCKAAPYELKEQFFLQSAYTESDYGCPHIKIRNSNTTGATQYDFLFNYNKGIFIDVFPIDNIPDDDDEFHLMCEEIKAEQRKIDIGIRKFYYVGEEIITDKEKEYCCNYIKNIGIQKAYSIMENKCMKYRNIKTKRCTCLAFHLNDYINYDCADFDDIIRVDFESTDIVVPNGYNHFLTQRYGNYMKPVKGGALHGNLIVSFDTPYRDYKIK